MQTESHHLGNISRITTSRGPAEGLLFEGSSSIPSGVENVIQGSNLLKDFREFEAKSACHGLEVAILPLDVRN